MKLELPAAPRSPRTYVVLDLESAVLDRTAHSRYQQMERWVPDDSDRPSRPGYTRGEDPLKSPRWCFQTITTASILIAREHIDGGIDVSRFVTYSAPDHDERSVLAGVLKELADTSAEAELCSWGGAMHDVPLLIAGCARYGLTLPVGWGWLAFGGKSAARHLDLLRVFTGGFAMKPIHQTEMLAAMDLPGTVLLGPGQSGVVEVLDPGGTSDSGHFVFHRSSRAALKRSRKRRTCSSFFDARKKACQGSAPEPPERPSREVAAGRGSPVQRKAEGEEGAAEKTAPPP